MKKLLMLLSALLLIAGCGDVKEKDEKQAPILTLNSSKEVTVGASGGDGRIDYTLENPKSDVEIQVKVNTDWVLITKSGDSIRYDVDANNSESSRTATITVTYDSEQFNVKVTQEGKPKPTTGNHNGYAWVDLGLSVKWATCNVGASSAEQYGNYYAWGETSPKSSYTKDNSKTWNKNIGDIAGNATYDAARANWGGSWRMPTNAEFKELINNCTWTWTTQNGKRGYKVTSKKNGNSIFLPAAGFRYGTGTYYDGSNGYYWSSTPYSDAQVAYRLYFDEGCHFTQWYLRDYGQSVRPVLE